MPKKTAAQLQREIDQALSKKSTHANEPLQESPARKAEWLREAKRRFPVDSHVRVAKSDEPRYVGIHGTVIGYDVGLMGDWPLVRVRLAAPMRGTVDGFYGDGKSDDEIVRVREGKSSAGRRAHATKKPHILTEEGRLADLQLQGFMKRSPMRTWIVAVEAPSGDPSEATYVEVQGKTEAAALRAAQARKPGRKLTVRYAK